MTSLLAHSRNRYISDLGDWRRRNDLPIHHGGTEIGYGCTRKIDSCAVEEQFSSATGLIPNQFVELINDQYSLDQSVIFT